MRTTFVILATWLGLSALPAAGSPATRPGPETHTARGRIEIRTAAPGIVAPTEPKLTFALKSWIDFPEPDPPEDVRRDRERYVAWLRKWQQTDEYRAAIKAHAEAEAAAPRFPFEPNPDGTFEVHGLPAGRYRVILTNDAEALVFQGRLRYMAGPLAVPATRPATTQAPTTRPPTTRPIARFTWLWAKGDPAPDVTLQFFDGQTRRLSDYRGKTVVLHFWGTWCAPCVAGLPGWQKLHDEIDGDPTKAILHINHGDSIERASRFLADRGYNWTQVTDAWSNDAGQVTTPLGVEGYPSIAIIDPAGRIVYVGIGTAEIARSNLFPTPTTGPAPTAKDAARPSAGPGK